jgi:hypothetical protein
MSDGTVPFEVGKKVQKRAEEITKEQGIKIVTTEGSETSRRNNPQTGDKNCNHD